MLRLAALLLLTSCATRAIEIPLAEKQRGMSYACAFSRDRDIRYGSPASAASLDKLRTLGVNWISITPFGFQRGTPEIAFGGPRVWEDDDSLRAVTAQARERGMKVLLKPHLWVRGEAAMNGWNESDWQAWFVQYERFLVHYATLAALMNVDAFSIGNELKRSTRYQAEWRRLIARVRSIYKGPLTYGANFDEFRHVAFWDALDWIGISAYFPLLDARTPSREALVTAWEPIVRELAAFSARWERPIVFTEIGYRSADGAAWRQWEIPRDAPLNLEAQTNAYEAFFQAVWPQPWLAGVFPWKWFSYVGHGGPANTEWELEGKPAEGVVGREYGRGLTIQPPVPR